MTRQNSASTENKLLQCRPQKDRNPVPKLISFLKNPMSKHISHLSLVLTNIRSALCRKSTW